MGELDVKHESNNVLEHNLSNSKEGEVVQMNELLREFKPRHTSMFAIACAIGTGLIIGSGTGLTRGGPASLIISYILIGLCVYFVMTALGEMAAFLPMKKAFGGYATRMVDPALGSVKSQLSLGTLS
jgi:yeast amino acid transporter